MALPLQTRPLTVNEAKARLLEPEAPALAHLGGAIQRHPGVALVIAGLVGIVIARSPKARAVLIPALIGFARNAMK